MNPPHFFPLSSVSSGNDPKVSCLLLPWISVLGSDLASHKSPQLTTSLQSSQTREEKAFPVLVWHSTLCCSSGQKGVLGLHLQGHSCPQPLCPHQHTPRIMAEGEIRSQFQKSLFTSVLQQQLLLELWRLDNFLVLKRKIWFASWNFWQVHNGSNIMDIINSLKWSSRNSNSSSSVIYCSDF